MVKKWMPFGFQVSQHHRERQGVFFAGARSRANITFDQALAACVAKGEGMAPYDTMETRLLINWCENNGFIPIGNNDYGKHVSETNYKAIPQARVAMENRAYGNGNRTLTWFHDNTPSGIDGLGGNVRDWVGGLRMVYGELQVLANNNGADSTHSQGPGSLAWKAIRGSDGVLIDPNGSGTTPGSVKMDWVGGALVYSTAITDANPGEHYCNFGVITADSSVGDNAKVLLQALGLLPTSPDVLSKSDRCYFNNGAEERLFYCGGGYSDSALGFGTFHGARSRRRHATLVFAAYVELPSA